MPDAVRTTTSQRGCAARGAAAAPRGRRARHRQVEEDEVGLRAAARARGPPPRRQPRRRRRSVLLEQRREGVACQGMVVCDQDAHSHDTLIGRRGAADKRHVRTTANDDTFDSWLVGETLLVALLASATALFLDEPVAPEQLRAARRAGSCSTRRSCSRQRSSRFSPASGSASRAAGSICCSPPGSASPLRARSRSRSSRCSVESHRTRRRPGRPSARAVLAAALIALAPVVPGGRIAARRPCCS